jgi:hypothetical protein
MTQRAFKITSITMHVGQHVTGEVRNSVNAKRHNAEMSITEIGVHIDGPGTNKLIPFSNIQCVDFEIEEAAK